LGTLAAPRAPRRTTRDWVATAASLRLRIATAVKNAYNSPAKKALRNRMVFCHGYESALSRLLPSIPHQLILMWTRSLYARLGMEPQVAFMRRWLFVAA